MAAISQLIQDASKIVKDNEKLVAKQLVLERWCNTHRKIIRHLNSEIRTRDAKIESLTFKNEGLKDQIEDLKLELLAKQEELDDLHEGIDKIKKLVLKHIPKVADVKTYRIIDNGYAAFLAEVDYDASSVRVGSLEHSKDTMTDVVLTIPKFLRCWVGDNRPRNTEAYKNVVNVYFRPELGKLNFGNCLLFQISDTGYILVTMEIIYFELHEQIVDFFSALTNSAMVIPIIVCEHSVLCSYWDMLSYPKTDITLDPLFHAYDDNCKQGRSIPAYYLVGRLFDSVRHEKYRGSVEWNDGLFETSDHGDNPEVCKGLSLCQN